jgi:hypothetical protein
MRLSSFGICCLSGFGFPFIPLLSISSGISTSICINSPLMPSYAFPCICGDAELPRSSHRPKVSLWCIKSIINAGLSSKRKGQNCGEGLPVWLPELLVQVWSCQPLDHISPEVAFGLATTLVVPHRDPTCLGGAAPAGYEGATSSS